LVYSGTKILVAICHPYGQKYFSFVDLHAVELFCSLGPGRLDSAAPTALDGNNLAAWIYITTI